MKKVEVFCDNCGSDLTWTSNCEGWRLALINDPIPNKGGLVTSMNVYPHLDKNCHFCSTSCLQKWVDEYFGEKIKK